MSSGNFETLFFQKAVPLIDDVTGYSTLTMFAVGPNGYLEGHSFYDYQSTCGFQDSSTLTTLVNAEFNSTLTSQISTLNLNIASTIAHVNSNIAFIGKTYVSTIPLMEWVSSTTVTNYPFYYNSTFLNGVSTGVLAKSYPINFASTGMIQYSSSIITNSFWLGNDLSDLINSRKYSVYADIQYSLYLSANTTSFTWVSTLGVFNQLDNPSYTYGNKGVSFTTRIGNINYSHINTSLVFNPQTLGYNTQIPINVSNFHFEIYLTSSIATSRPAFDIFMPGYNNVTFTLVPVPIV